MNSNKTYKLTGKKNQAQGFTLLEMIVVLLLIVVLMAWGFPNYQSLKARRMATDFSNEVLYSFTQARAEAVRYGSNVEVRPTGGAWQGGWQTVAIGVDGAADTLIAIQPAIRPELSFAASGLATGTMVFNSIGGLEGATERSFLLSHTVDTSVVRNINVNLSGSTKVNKP